MYRRRHLEIVEVSIVVLICCSADKEMQRPYRMLKRLVVEPSFRACTIRIQARHAGLQAMIEKCDTLNTELVIDMSKI